jgi:hypothetical protein
MNPPSRRWDGAPETEFDTRFFDLRDSGYTGPINQDGYPVTSGEDARILRDMAARRGEDTSWWTGQDAERGDRPDDRLLPVAMVVLAVAMVVAAIVMALR